MAVQIKEREHSDVETEQLATGCEAIAEAIRLADVDVMAAYRIRPYAETAQEAMDLALMAWRVGEDKRVSLPVAIGLDGAFLTHSQQIVKIPTQAAVDKFLPKFDLGDRLLHPDNPITIAPQVDQDWLMEIRRQNDAAMRNALGVIREAHADFKRIFGRGGESPFLDEYMTDDAEVVVIGQGTLSLPMKRAIRRLRKERGLKIGLVRLKWFRPFPTEEVVKSLRRFKAVGVIARDYSFGSPYYGGVLYNEIRSALYSQTKRPTIVGFVAGLGGREIEQPMATEIFEKVEQAAKSGPSAGDVCHWIGVRE